ncbi:MULTISPECIES: aspartate aminotransferase family protein [unclassified Oceanispirochaeta]|uniref:aspartate aminotransferase family protein n=1 Tax=unclassified Oceanispirochaeta TaxID=2635722 RepID=UPI000E097A3E|nr:MULTISPECIES: aminotransferase class III-fold pyridoxal phosphate-dependent enzyme [unclassified Oceanispirochaeta]MBF9017870.1 aminotransferase class III-fold pyridoxal phosphate-dependent enzyme [Oceanispirochaeta sp. M2]NPD74381.1 aminotransferase class III-fold pyridoxal phosphate-dependent enzyme [Oceanispirochaeta sp. M1]RDG29767.1 aminotransferase class III-fold pyridoxal phosphate-dependent enzyme [Oceanispirochaeta sp. M1]
MSNGFAISEYHDAEAVIKDLNALISQPIRTLKKEALEKYLEYFENNCQKSKAMLEEAKEVIKGGVQHNLAFNYPFPLAFEKAEGATLTDIDGNEYIDFLQAGGPTVLGSNPEVIRNKVIEVLNTCGPVTGLFHEYEMKLAKMIVKHYPGVDKFRMLGSGTEACMASIRVARLATKKKNIVKMGGAYHGWSDQLSYGNRIPGVGGLESHGIPANCYKYTQEAYPGDIKALKRVLIRNQLRGGTACVILEPIGPESGTRPLPKEYPAQVRKLCDKFGALLIFDEVVTGFRLGMSGAQGYFGVTPDLTIFGKVVAGGYPSAGGLGGKDEYIEFLAGGVGGKKGKKAHVGGTMAANPISSAAGYYTLLEMEKTNAPEVAGKAGDRLTKGLQELIKKYDLPFVAYNQGSICHLETVGTMLFDINLMRFWEIPAKLKEIHKRKDVMTHMGAAYMAEGIVTLAGSRMYTSAVCTDKVIDDALVRFERVFKNIEGVSA